MKNRFKAMLISGAAMISAVTWSNNTYAVYEPPFGCEIILGDCSEDGVFDYFDVELLQKWLLGANVQISEYNSDFNYDGNVDIFDLCMMKNELLKFERKYSEAEFWSKDEDFHIKADIETDYLNRSEIKLKWYDSDGDIEKTDTIKVKNAEPFAGNSEWQSDTVFGSENYSLVWGVYSLRVNLIDDGEMREVMLVYPNREITEQKISKDIINKKAPEITSVEVIAESCADLGKKVTVSQSSDYLSKTTVGRVGTPIKIQTAKSIDSFTAVIHYDEKELRWVPERNLTVLEYDKSVPQYMSFKPAADAVADTEANTITFSGKNNCEYILVDVYEKSLKADYSYKVNDITEYISDWEREGNTGDIMKLADKEWVKKNVINAKIKVSNPTELASAVYYINAVNTAPKAFSGLTNISIELTGDINLSGFDWKPITEFRGELFGNNHVIKNMTLKDINLSDIGFTAVALRCGIYDISFENAYINCRNRAANVGIAAGKCEFKPEFRNVSVSGEIISNSYARCGEISGYGEAKLSYCTSDVIITK